MLLEMSLVRDQKDLSVEDLLIGEQMRSNQLCFTEVHFTWTSVPAKILSWMEICKLWEWKFHSQNVLYPAWMTMEQTELKHGFGGEKYLVKEGMNFFIPPIISFQPINRSWKVFIIKNHSSHSWHRSNAKPPSQPN